jgi:uncharacterized protein
MILVDVKDLIERPGASRRVHIAERVQGLTTEVARVPEDRPVQADLLLESVVEGILVSGPVTAPVELSCARCLTPIQSEFAVDVQELFSPDAGSEQDEYPLREASVDLEPMVRDAVVLAMPFAPLCRPDCRGLCERCGGDRNLDECTCGPSGDPRWAPLSGLSLEETDHSGGTG